MKWTTLPEKPAPWGPELWAFELAKIEALRAIAEELELVRSDVQNLEAALAVHHRAGDPLAAARGELENVLNVLEAEASLYSTPQKRGQLRTLLARARELLRRDLP